MHSELTGIGPYRLTRMLAAGDSQTVYLGHLDGDPEDKVTVTVLHAALASDPAVADAFLQRAHVGAKLKGKRLRGVSAVRDSGTATALTVSRPWVASEPVHGVNLEQLIAEKKRFKLPVDAATNLVIRILDALAGAAKHRVVHGHLRASDIWLDSDGQVSIAHFGVADDPQADFLAVTRLLQEIGTDWVPEVDAWLDGLQREDPPFRNAEEARAAFPLTLTDAGHKRLARTAKASLKKRTASNSPGSDAAGTTSPGAAAGATPTRRAAGRRVPRLRPIIRRPATPEEAERAAREAQRIATICLFILGLGLAIEVF